MLRWIEGFELGLARTRYNVGGLSYDWTFTTGAGGDVEMDYTGSGRWVPSTGVGGGSYAMSCPHEATALTRSLTATNDPDIDSWVLAFAVNVDALGNGIKNNHVLVEVLDQSGNAYVKVQTANSGSPFSLKGYVWDGSSWSLAFHTSQDWSGTVPYWLILDFRRGDASPYVGTLSIYRGTLTSQPVKLNTGTPINLNADRYIGKVRWTGVADTTDGGSGVTIIDSVMLWSDPDADSPYCFRAWFVQGLNTVIDQTTQGNGTFTPSGMLDNAAMLISGDTAYYSEGELTATSGTATLAMKLQDLVDVDSSLVFPVVRDIGGACVTFTASDAAQLNQVGGFLWRGGSYVPAEVTDLYWSAPALEQYQFCAYGVDPTGSKWTSSTLADASAVIYISGGSLGGTVRFIRYVVQVAWNGLDPITSRFTGPGPDAYILVHDPALVRTDASLSTTDGVSTPSQTGPVIGIPYGATTNNGSLLPFHGSQEWDTTADTKHPVPIGIDYRMQSGGGVMGSAEWAWKFQDDASDQYRGQLDIRLERDTHNPWGTNFDPNCIIAFTSSAFRRSYAGRYNATDWRWEIRWYSTTQANRMETQGEVYVPNSTGFLDTPGLGRKYPDVVTCPYACIWETPDGAIRMAWVYSVPGTSTYDLDIWGSSDGGDTWTLLQENVLNATMGRDTTPVYITADSSGDWVRISFWDSAASPQGICTIASSDRGSTWKLVQGTPDGLDNVSAPFNPSNRQMHDIVGVDTADGMFMRFRKISSTTTLRVEVASGTDDWSIHPYTETAYWTWPVTYMESIQTVRTPTHLWTLIWDTGAGLTSNSCVSGFGVQRDHVLDRATYIGASGLAKTEEWTVLAQYQNGGMHPLKSGAYYMPTQWRAAWTGDSIMVVAGLFDIRVPGGSPSIQQRAMVSYFGGWDRFPTRGTEAINVGRYKGLTDRQWVPQYGTPNQGGAFSATTGGTPVLTDYYYGFNLLTAPGESWYWAAGPITGHMGDAGCVECSLELTSGVTFFAAPTSPAYYLTPNAGFILSGTTSTGTTIHVSVHVTGTGVYMYDAVGGSTLFSDLTLDTTVPVTYRLRASNAAGASRPGSTTWYAELQYKTMGTDGPWVSSGLITTTDGHISGIAGQFAAFGTALPVAGTCSATWFGYNQTAGELIGGAPGETNPTSIRGAQASTYPYHVAQGVEVTWGGGGGYIGDSWQSEIKYRYGVDQLTSPSPAQIWRTDGHTTTAVILDASKYRGTAGQTVTDRFHHNAVALVGTNYRYAWIDYAENTAFSSTVPTSAMTVDAAVFSARIGAAGTNTVNVELVGTAGDLDSHLRSNAVAGWFFEYADPTSGSTHDGKVFKVLESWDDRLRVDYTTASLSTVLQAGGTLTFFPPWMVLPYSQIDSAYAAGIDQRFMRVQIRTTGNKIPEDDAGFETGRIVAGMTLPLSVPMSWESRDTEEGNVQLFTAISGSRSAYKAGPPRRSIEGTSVGDVSRWRDSWRGTIRTISQYDLHPMVLVRDANQDTLSALYGRMTSSTELANVGYRYNSALGRWETVGDVSMLWEEEV